MNRAERRRLEKEAKKRAIKSGGDPAADMLSPAAAQTLNLALQHHGAGRLPEAEAAYRQVLSENPKHAATLHFLGVIAYQSGKPDAAVELIERALAAKPTLFEAWNNLGAAYRQLGRTADAIASYEKAIAIKPDYAEAHFNLGNALSGTGDTDGAVAAFRRAVEIEPAHAAAHNNLGNALKVQGQLEAAAASYGDAIRAKPDFAEAQNNLGTALLDLGRPEEAGAALRRALALMPGVAETHVNLGNALADLGRADEALESYGEALRLQPEYAEAHFNMGNALRDFGRAGDALAAFDKAVALRPDYVDAHVNRGNVLQDLRRLDDAEASYRHALEIDPAAAEAATNLGLLQLLRGNFADGWRNYAWRFRRRDVALKPREYDRPKWTGDSLAGRGIFVYPEQGYGDTIQFARYLPMLQAMGADVTFEVPAPLGRLFEAGAFSGKLVAEGETPAPFDCHASLLELPRLLGTTAETIPPPGDMPAVPEDLASAWVARLGGTGGLKVGIVWGGRPTHANDANRSLPPEALKPLADVPGVRLHSLQVGRDGEAGQVFGAAMHDLAPDLGDFADTAAAMLLLDLMISVDTSVAHLAGTLGRPVWTLLPFTPDWRWQLDRDDSPWYPSMRLFRQESGGDWPGVVGRVQRALFELAQ
jgi:tetratricopeptide (TPR) repeat protein